jgi:hypothetical protein
MQLAERRPPSVLAQRTSDAETVVWFLILALLGISAFAIISLLERLEG